MASAGVVPPASGKEKPRDRKAEFQEKVARHAAERGVLLVRVHDLPKTGGILSERQRQWVASAPYDSSTENPVLYKRGVEAARPARVATERQEARQQVQSLVDKPVLHHSSSNLAERISQSRKERHEQTMHKLRKGLAAISDDLEPQVLAASELLKSQLAENDQVILSLFAGISSPEVLQNLTLDCLQQVWQEVVAQTPKRRAAIASLDGSLAAVEGERGARASGVLQDHAHQLEKVGYLLPGDVARAMEQEAHGINMAILANKQNYTRLFLNLVTAECGREREHRERWEGAVEEWRQLVCSSTHASFRGYLESGEVRQPLETERLKELLAAEQKGLNSRRQELLAQLAKLAPPSVTMAAVYEWNESMKSVHQQLERVHSGYLLRLQESLEGVAGRCEERVDQCRNHLIESKAFDTPTVYEILSTQFLPLVEEHAAREREGLQRMERALDLVLAAQKTHFQTLFQSAQTAAHLWESHCTSLAEKQRTFQEGLEKCRSSHNADNQNLEANLDVVLDRLRQGACSQALKDYLQEAYRMLETIKTGYQAFHSELLRELQHYPALVAGEVAAYDTQLSQYFKPPSPPKKARSSLNVTRSPSDVKASDSKSSVSGKRPKKRPSRAKTMAAMATVPGGVATRGAGLSAIVEEVISTSEVTSFVGHTPPRSPSDLGSTFLTQDEEIEGAMCTSALESISLSEEGFAAARRGLRTSFLAQLERWKGEMSSHATDHTAGKEEEVHTELDLRLHLHEPRPSRVEQDIFTVRAAELAVHKERVSRHAQGVVAAIAEQKSLLQLLAEAHDKQSESFSQEMASTELALSGASNTTGLRKILAHAKRILEQHTDAIEALSSSHEEQCGEVLRALSEANNSFSASLKLFSEGGNYCPSEVELFSKKLEKLSSKLAAAHSLVVSEVSSLAQTHRLSARATMEAFRGSYELHLADLTFLELISRTLTSTQVRIKSEVAASNSQARVIFDASTKLSSLMENCVEVQDGAAEVMSSLPELFHLLSARTDYLFCRATVRGARVGFQGETSGGSPKPHPPPISAVNLTKSIMEYASGRAKSGGGDETVLSAGRQSRSGTSAGVKGATAEEQSRKSCSRQGRKKQAAPERRHVSFGIGGGAEDSSCLLPTIRAILKSTHSELYKMAEEYYKSKGNRPTTRPPPGGGGEEGEEEVWESFEQCLDALIERCHCYQQQAEAYRNDCIDELHSQLATVMSLLVAVPPLLLAGGGEGRRRRREGEGTGGGADSSDYSQTAADLERERASHECSLRPALGHPNQTQQLAELCQREEQRHSTTLESIHRHASNSIASEGDRVRGLVAAVLEQSQALLTLFDAATTNTDLIPGSDKLKQKPAMGDLLRKHLRPPAAEDSSSRGGDSSITAAAAAVAVMMAPSKSSKGELLWPGLPEPLHQLVVGTLPRSTEKEEEEEEEARQTSRTRVKRTGQSGRAGSTGTTDAAPEKGLAHWLGAKVTSRTCTAAHQAVIECRDETVKEHMARYRGAVRVVEVWREEALAREEKWATNWRQSVFQVKALYQ